MDLACEATRAFEKTAQRIPRHVRVKGDIYGFTTWNAALVHGMVLILVVLGAWLLCDHYREQAQEIIQERDYYCRQIESYKRNNLIYARLFPEYSKTYFGN